MRIAIAEDNILALKAIIDKLRDTADVQVKYTADNGKNLLEKFESDPVIDLVLMDIQMPVMNGIEATRLLHQRYPHIKIVMLTTFDDDENIFNAIVGGASGYLLKEESSETILQALRNTMDGGAAMSPGIALKVLNLVRQPIQAMQTKQDFGITPREVELLEQLKNGLTYDQIASNLFISSGTVRKHIQNIYAKLQVNNKVEALEKARQHRIF